MKRIMLMVTVALMLGLMVALSGAALAQGADVCVSIKGETKVQKGESFCQSDETSRAVAVNAMYAVALGDSKAVAVNNGSQAFAFDNGKATAVNDFSLAVAELDSKATAVNHSLASSYGSSAARGVNDGFAVAEEDSKATAVNDSVAYALRNCTAMAKNGEEVECGL